MFLSKQKAGHGVTMSRKINVCCSTLKELLEKMDIYTELNILHKGNSWEANRDIMIWSSYSFVTLNILHS